MRAPEQQKSYQISGEERTWYGLPVDISISSDNIHRVNVAGLALTHPGLVNMISRWGLPQRTRLELTYRHEMAHLQTLLVPVLHLVILYWPRPGHPRGSRKLRGLIGLLTHQIMWEVASESYLAATDRRAYRAPRPPLAHLLYAVFWAGMAIFSLLGTLFLVQRKRTFS